MNSITHLDPAVKAADEAISRILHCLDQRKSFCLEAGAGSGKTHSLAQALTYLIQTRGDEFLRRSQKIACISYTNAASNIITARTNQHPAILSSTIHSFCWSLIKDHQTYLRAELSIAPNWAERLAATNGIGSRSIEYTLGHPSAPKDANTASLGHGDVLTLATKLLGYEKFRRLLASRHPVIFIDEYQDTDTNFIEALKAHILGKDCSPIFGFFGDPWQRIYGKSCGDFDHASVSEIQQGANFRSRPAIVETLNRMRPNLRQSVRPHDHHGSVAAYHTNEWQGLRQAGSHWKGDLPATVAHAHLNALRVELESQGWDFSPDKTKILMLTHNVLAQEQGYSNLAKAFKRNDDFASKEDDHIKFFVDVLEPACRAYATRRYGDMFVALNSNAPTVRSQADKKSWAEDMEALVALRSTATIGDVLEHLSTAGRPHLPEALEEKERLFTSISSTEGEIPPWIEQFRALRQVLYREVIALANFLDASTLYSTKHGVKGDEFENVLVVVGRGWNLYDFNEFLEISGNLNAIPKNRSDAYERNRNLLYVAFSRARVRLAVLFTQKLSPQAISTLSHWFGEQNVHSFEPGDT